MLRLAQTACHGLILALCVAAAAAPAPGDGSALTPLGISKHINGKIDL